ncbi:glycoside hydrolase family 25 protein [Endozoicomonas numazuensis]|uniref:glycoside hydrolase family 25 protein n=1 Tax=Endozoicomonas numazuensis TaxID=1137799 RepID=UPI000690ABC6|nr:GH25 family lysozyme [Endozoicomonas numazuensis]
MPQTARRYGFYFLDALLLLAIIHWLHSSAIHLLDQSSNNSTLQASADTPAEKQTVATHLLGIDVSHYQGNVDWKEVSESFHFAFVKATEGTDYIDPDFTQNISRVDDTDLAYGAYHFYSPDEDGLKQAKHFVSTIHNLNFSLPPVLDVEVAPDSDSDIANFQQSVKSWLVYVENTMGCRPIIYSDKSFWDEYLKETFSHYTVWISDYTTHTTDVANINWAFWQFTDQGKAEGVSGFVDQSRFKGSEQSLYALGDCQI